MSYCLSGGGDGCEDGDGDGDGECIQTKYVSVKHAFILPNCHRNAITPTLTNIMMENTRFSAGALQPRIYPLITAAFLDGM